MQVPPADGQKSQHYKILFRIPIPLQIHPSPRQIKLQEKKYAATEMTTLCDRMLTERDPERALELAQKLRERLGEWVKRLEKAKTKRSRA
jgi:hypothetical protein